MKVSSMKESVSMFNYGSKIFRKKYPKKSFHRLRFYPISTWNSYWLKQLVTLPKLQGQKNDVSGHRHHSLQWDLKTLQHKLRILALSKLKLVSASQSCNKVTSNPDVIDHIQIEMKHNTFSAVSIFKYQLHFFALLLVVSASARTHVHTHTHTRLSPIWGRIF